MIVSDTFKKYILEEANPNNYSLRRIAREIGISASHLSNILNQNHTASPEILNNLAEFLGRDIADVYYEAGLLDLDQDEQFVIRLKEAIQREPQLKQLLDAILDLDVEDRANRVSLILAALGK